MALFSKSESSDALAFLKQDHRAVERLFRQFESAGRALQPALVRRICDELTVHAALEEKVFYPAVRQALPDMCGILDEAGVEHDSIRRLIELLSDAKQGDPMMLPRMKVLKEYVKHHVREEEYRMMLKLRRSDLDLDAIGQELMDKKQRLMSGRSRSKSRVKKRGASPGAAGSARPRPEAVGKKAASKPRAKAKAKAKAKAS